MRSNRLKNLENPKSSVNQEYLTSLNQVAASSFAEIGNARNIIVVATTSDVTALKLMLKSFIQTKNHITTAVLVNSQTPRELVKKYHLYPFLSSPSNHPIQNAIDLIGERSFETMFYFQNPLVPQGDFIKECVVGSVHSGKIVDLSQRIVCGGQEFSSFGQIHNSHQGVSEFSQDVSYCRLVNAIDLQFFSISRELVKSFLDNYSELTDLELAISLFLMQKGVEIQFNPFVKFISLSTIQAKQLSRPWDQSLSSHKVQREIQSHLRRKSLQQKKSIKVVFVEVGIPKPDRDAASVTHLWYLKTMRALGFEIVYISAFSEEPQQPYSDVLYRMGIKIISAHSPSDLQNRVKEELSTNGVLFVCRALLGSHLIPVVKSRTAEVKIVFNTVDLDFLRNERLAILTRDGKRLDESLIAQFEEINLVSLADETLVVSSFEQELLQKELPSKSIRHVRLPYVVRDTKPSFQETSSVIFAGGFNHKPNYDSVLYLIREIWPHVQELDSGIELRIVGSDTPKEIMSLDNPGQGIHVLGFIDDLEGLIQTSRISLAPLLYGAGAKGKVLQALSLGIPVIGTKVAAEGVGLIDGFTITIAEEPKYFAKSIVDLYSNQKRWESLQDNGMTFVKSEHSPEGLIKLFDEILR
jgi:glycosyltransferase involved in cell wall biosynthesis